MNQPASSSRTPSGTMSFIDLLEQIQQRGPTFAKRAAMHGLARTYPDALISDEDGDRVSVMGAITYVVLVEGKRMQLVLFQWQRRPEVELALYDTTCGFCRSVSPSLLLNGRSALDWPFAMTAELVLHDDDVIRIMDLLANQ